MKKSIIILACLNVILGLSSVLVAQTKTKAKSKTKAKITKPVSNPTDVGETKKNLSKTKNMQNKSEAAVFEPNDANTWIETHEFQPAITGKGQPKSNSVVQGGTTKKPVVFEDVIVSSKTSKPKRKPTKAAASKRKTN